MGLISMVATETARAPLFKMAELVRRTGVRKETIHFYIQNGLLPRPAKAEKNVAYYDESYVKRIRQIKELQLKYFLPLKVIRDIIPRTDPQMSPTEMDLLRVGVSGLLHLQEIRRTRGPESLEELSSRTGLPKEEILEMERCEMISSRTGPGRRRTYNEEDIRVVEAFAGIRKGGMTRELGFEVEHFRMQSDVVSALAIEEVKDFVRKLRGKLPEDPELLGKISENAIETVNAFIWQLRRKKILETAQELAEKGLKFLAPAGSAGRSKRSSGKGVTSPHRKARA